MRDERLPVRGGRIGRRSQEGMPFEALVGHDLDFHVTRIWQIAFDIDGAVAEEAQPFRRRALVGSSDVIGAQRALTTTLSSVVSNVISLILVLITMLVLSWQVTLIALILLPIFIFPAKWVGKRLQKISREQMQRAPHGPGLDECAILPQRPLDGIALQIFNSGPRAQLSRGHQLRV